MRFSSLIGFRLLAVTAGILLIGSSVASARPHHRTASRAVAAPSCFLFCGEQTVVQTRAQARAAAREARRQAAEQAAKARQEAAQQRAALRQQAALARHQSASSVDVAPRRRVAEVVLGGRPAGCPIKFCGCGASLEVFGRIIPRLNRAANWFVDFARVSHANAATGMVAGNRSHVFVLHKHLGGDDWLVKNYNGKGHRTTIQQRKITRYTVVDPHRRRYAAAF